MAARMQVECELTLAELKEFVKNAEKMKADPHAKVKIEKGVDGAPSRLTVDIVVRKRILSDAPAKRAAKKSAAKNNGPKPKKSARKRSASKKP